jgi:hypothetical protein
MECIEYNRVPYTIDGDILKTTFTPKELHDVYNFFDTLWQLRKHNREQYVKKNISINLYKIIENSFSDFVYDISLFSEYNKYGKEEFLENVETINKQSVTELHSKLCKDLLSKSAKEIQYLLDNPSAYRDEYLYIFED